MIRNDMTSRERMEAKLEGKEVDHMPFWPKITQTYVNFQQEKWRRAGLKEIHRYIGSDFLSFSNVDVQISLPETMAMDPEIQEGDRIRGAYRVNGHVMSYASLVTEDAGDYHPVKYPIQTLDDIKYMTEFFEHAEYFIRPEEKIRHDKVIKENSSELFLHCVESSPVMKLMQNLMDVENFVYMFYDYPDEMNALIDVLQKASLKRLETELQGTPQKYFISIENTSTSLISPDIFKNYCLGHLQEQNKLITKYHKKQILHMCGKLFLILPLINQIDAVAMEAFTSNTTGDTDIKDGYRYLPDKVLIGGTCASTWVLPENEIIKRIQKDLDEAGRVDKLFLSSGGEMPFAATPEVIHHVWNNIKNYIYN